MIKQMFQKMKSDLKRYGFFKTIQKIMIRILKLNRKNTESAKQTYQKLILQNEPSCEELEKQRKNQFLYEPKISIVVPLYNTNENFFLELLNSLLVQTYGKWELCIVDGSKEQNETIFAMCSRCSKVRYKFLGENKGISENTNRALEMVSGDYIAFLDHDDCLPPFSLYEIVKTINENPEVEFIYSDEDKMEREEERFDPYFKPDFSPETLTCHNYITHFVVLRKDLVEKVGKLDSRFDGAQDFDFVLRATEQTQNIIHIPKVLYHWRAHKHSTAQVAHAKNYAYEAGMQAIQEHLERTKVAGIVKNPGEIPGIYQVKYEVKNNPSVSIIILDKNDEKALTRCLKSILKLTSYKKYEVYILSNNESLNLPREDQRVKIIKYDKDLKEDFEILNWGAKNAIGEFVVSLDCQTKLLTPDWLEIFLGYAQRRDVGVVGARIYNQHKTIQNIGTAYDIAENAEELLAQLPSDWCGYFGQKVATRNVKTVSNACFITRKEWYEKGWITDVDFCLKILEKGYQVVYNPYVELIQYERKQK